MFTCQSGRYRFRRIPFGLTNAPATFHRTLNTLLSGLKWRIFLISLDDLIEIFKSFDAYLKDVNMVLSMLRIAVVSLNLKTFCFVTDRVKYLGHIIKPGALTIDESRVERLKKLQHPRNVTKLQFFLGFFNLYRHSVPNHIDISAPLTKLLQKGQPKHLPTLDDRERQAFDKLIRTISINLLLALPRPAPQFGADTDKNDYQVGAALLLIYPDGDHKPI